MTDVSVGVRAKRKRGRPRKDSNMCREGSFQSLENSSLAHPAPVDISKKDCCSEGMVGSMVYGVVEGSFDAGYLVSVRIGSNNLTPFRGVVFQPRKVVAVTAANDVAPQAMMHQRREIPVSAYDDSGFSQPKQAVGQPSFTAADEAMLRTGSSSDVEAEQLPYVHLRMVEEDEVMQAFELDITCGKESINQVQEAQMESAPSASNLQLESMPSVLDPMICHETMDQLQEMNAGESPQAMKNTDMYYNEARSQDVNFFTEANSCAAELVDSSSISKSSKEKQVAADNTIYMGYHQALVTGNPLLLPPDLTDEPLEFMMERPKTPPDAAAHGISLCPSHTNQ